MLTLTSLSIQVGTEERYELLHVLEFTRYSYYVFIMHIHHQHALFNSLLL